MTPPTPRKRKPDPADPDTTGPLEPDAGDGDGDQAADDRAATFTGGIPVDPGPAYAAGEAPPADPDGQPAALLPAPPQPITPEQAIMALRALWGACRLGVKLTGGGPDDVFQPSAADLREQAQPLVALATRYPIIAVLVAQSDYAAALILIGGYAAGEVQRTGEHRAAEQGAPVDFPDDVRSRVGVREGVGQPSRPGGWTPQPPPPPPAPADGPNAGEAPA